MPRLTVTICILILGCAAGCRTSEEPASTGTASGMTMRPGPPSRTGDCQVFQTTSTQTLSVRLCKDEVTGETRMGAAVYTIKDSAGAVVLYDSLDVLQFRNTCIADAFASDLRSHVLVTLLVAGSPNPDTCLFQ